MTYDSERNVLEDKHTIWRLLEKFYQARPKDIQTRQMSHVDGGEVQSIRHAFFRFALLARSRSDGLSGVFLKYQLLLSPNVLPRRTIIKEVLVNAEILAIATPSQLNAIDRGLESSDARDANIKTYMRPSSHSCLTW